MEFCKVICCFFSFPGDARFNKASSSSSRAARSPYGPSGCCGIMQVWKHTNNHLSVSSSCSQKRLQKFALSKIWMCSRAGSFSPCTESIWTWRTCLESFREIPGLSLRASDHSAPLVLHCLLLSVFLRYDRQTLILHFKWMYYTLVLI